MTRRRPALFRGRHFEDVIILLCVRRYLRYSLTYRDLEEIMAERGLAVNQDFAQKKAGVPRNSHAVKLEPHPQLLVEFGLMKLNP